jgi:hypothetical protein
MIITYVIQLQTGCSISAEAVGIVMGRVEYGKKKYAGNTQSLWNITGILVLNVH